MKSFINTPITRMSFACSCLHYHPAAMFSISLAQITGCNQFVKKNKELVYYKSCQLQYILHQYFIHFQNKVWKEISL